MDDTTGTAEASNDRGGAVLLLGRCKGQQPRREHPRLSARKRQVAPRLPAPSRQGQREVLHLMHEGKSLVHGVKNLMHGQNQLMHGQNNLRHGVKNLTREYKHLMRMRKNLAREVENPTPRPENPMCEV